MANKNWASVDVNTVPKIVTPLPGPEIGRISRPCGKIHEGIFESGYTVPCVI